MAGEDFDDIKCLSKKFLENKWPVVFNLRCKVLEYYVNK